MKKEIAEQWVEALRSGKYKQGQNRLKNYNKFCCLGVLCDISGLSEWGIDNNYFDNTFTLPTKVVDWAGMSEKIPPIDIDLMYLNDDKNLSFEQIADIIEKRWEEL